MSKTKEDSEANDTVFADAAGEVVAAMLGSFGIEMKVEAAPFAIGNLTEEVKDHVEAILKVEHIRLEDITAVQDQELETDTGTFRWFRDEEEAEAEALDYLTDSPSRWQDAVTKGDTTDGLTTWTENLIRKYGWASIIDTHDGYERVAVTRDGTWFPYIRVK